MKSIMLVYLSCLCLLTFQAAGQAAKNEFPLVIEGVSCQVKAYQATTPVILEPMVDQDFRPKSQLILAIMLTKTDISSHMSNEELIKLTGSRFDEEAVELHRSRMKKMAEMTGPAAADNPWKGMKYVVEQAFLVESERGRFLVYQLSTQGAKDVTGKLIGSIESVDGRWVIGGEKDDVGEKFQRAMLQLVPEEFEKMRVESSLESLPLEDLLE